MKLNFLLILSDRVRTVVNVLGDSFGAAIVEHLSEQELKAIPSNNINSASTTLAIEDRENGIRGADNSTFDERM